MQDSGVALSKEGYSLNWLGKSYARLLANENIRTRLVADTAHNTQPINANSQNLLIKGDNLEVLKHLMGAYSEQVKMIYIDPPYNTGSDGFVYQDDRKFTIEQLSSLAGIDEDEAKRILEFTSSHSNSHSAWLTFLYPRLYIAKQLLRDDGVIFISIDDNEQAQLKMLCDEVFGEENFVANLIWEKRFTRNNDAKMMSFVTDHVIFYRKSEKLTNLREPRTEKANSIYSNPDNDPRGDWTSVSYISQRTKEERKNLAYSMVNPFTNVEINHPVNAWKYSYEQYLIHSSENRLYWGKEAGNQYPRLKRFLAELNDGIVPVNLWSYKETGTSDDGTKEVGSLIGKDVFSYPKPTSLIERMAAMAVHKDSIILDFFAGSGTTAHAVMQLNAEDGGKRQFICVQIDEVTDPKSEACKAGYKTIFDITQARISKAAAKIKAENPLFAGDVGFKVFETLSMFDKYLDAPEELTENLELFDVNTLSQQDRHSLMLTWALRDGIKLGTALSPVTLGRYTAYAADKILYFVEPDISLTAVVALLEQLDNNPAFAPSRLVVLGYLLDSKTQREMTEAVKHYNNRKGIELTLDIRYN